MTGSKADSCKDILHNAIRPVSSCNAVEFCYFGGCIENSLLVVPLIVERNNCKEAATFVGNEALDSALFLKNVRSGVTALPLASMSGIQLSSVKRLIGRGLNG